MNTTCDTVPETVTALNCSVTDVASLSAVDVFWLTVVIVTSLAVSVSTSSVVPVKQDLTVFLALRYSVF